MRRPSPALNLHKVRDEHGEHASGKLINRGTLDFLVTHLVVLKGDTVESHYLFSCRYLIPLTDLHVCRCFAGRRGKLSMGFSWPNYTILMVLTVSLKQI
jgi:hypothetical protein